MKMSNNQVRVLVLLTFLFFIAVIAFPLIEESDPLLAKPEAGMHIQISNGIQEDEPLTCEPND